METWAIVTLVLGASAISSLLTFFITKMQIAARHQEQMRQIEYEKEQQRSARLVEFRHKWIQPLYVSLGNFAGAIDRQSNKLDLFWYYTNFIKNNDEARKEAIKEFQQAIGGAIGSCSELEKCAVPVSDKNLKSLIGRLATMQSELAPITQAEGFDIKEYAMAKEKISNMQELVADAFRLLEDISCGIGVGQ